MMRRPFYTWMAFGLCFLAALAAMGWISGAVIRLDRAEAGARRQGLVEENVRLALWRMDSALGPLVAQESANPYFLYSAFYPADHAYGSMFSDAGDWDVLSPSPLLTEDRPYIRLYFQFAPKGALTSPQVPGTGRPEVVPRDRLQSAAARLQRLGELMDRDALRRALLAAREGALSLAGEPEDGAAQARQELLLSQRDRNLNEYQRRAQAQKALDQNIGLSNAMLARPPNIHEEMMRPLWMNGELLLARRVHVDGTEYIQGCWMDWPAIRTRLLQEVKDLLPSAELRPIEDEAPAVRERRLASLPLVLAPGDLPLPAGGVESSHAVPLAFAWICFILAVLASAALLAGAMSLSERRGAFVSAVTHELRTPLTTLRMYTEMLAERMVPEEEKRMQYLATLRAEADRLAHLVENVLAYSRIERGARAGREENLTLEELLDRVEPRLRERAEGAGMRLVVETGGCDLEVPLRLDPGAVDQVLFNLVDNACKYAAGAGDPAIRLNLRYRPGSLEVRVRDNGPGIPKRDRKRLFQPFSKSAREAANSAQGVGLGLALSRRLARMMGGDLVLDDSEERGTCFVLKISA